MRQSFARTLGGVFVGLLLMVFAPQSRAQDQSDGSTYDNVPSIAANNSGNASKPGASGTATKRKPSAPVYSRYGSTTSTVIRPSINSQVTNQTQQALSFYGGNSARATLSQMPRRPQAQAAPAAPSHPVGGKPFQTVYREPTISPYLNLYRDDESSVSVPNYFAFVRPQMEQIEANRAQQREIQQLRGQLQGTSSTVVGGQYQPTPMPSTGTSTRYMDTAQFYGGLRR